VIGGLEARWPVILVALALLALAARITVALSVWSLPHPYLLNADAAEYHSNALAIAGLADGSIPPVFRLSPGTIFWGALWHRLFGPSPWAVILPQIALGCGTVLLAAACARRLGGVIAGLAAGLLAALCKPLILYETAILPTGPAVFFATLFAWIALETAGEFTLPRAAAIGLVLGLLIAFRTNAVLLVPVALALLIGARLPSTRRGRLLAVAVVLLIGALPVLPITVSNQVRGGAFVPVTSNTGMNLFIGNHQGSNGRLNPAFGTHTADRAFEVFSDIASKKSGLALNPAEVSAFWTDRTAEEIIDDPARFAALLGRKALYGLNGFETPDNVDPAFLGEISRPVGSPVPGFGFLFSLRIVGLVIIWRQRTPGSRAIHGVFAFPFATMLIFFVSGRYRAPAIPMLAIASGVTVAWALKEIAALRGRQATKVRRASSRLAAASVAIAVAAATTSLPILEPRFEIELARLSDAFVSTGDIGRAAACIRQLAAMARQSGDRQLEEWARGRLEELE